MSIRLLLSALLLSLIGASLQAADPPPVEAAGQQVVGKRLGLKPEVGKPKLRISWKQGVPPPSPTAVNHFTGWQFNMGGNDQFGSCGPTGAANHLGMSRKFLLGLDKPVPLAQVLDLYRRSSSPPFNPATGANDNGVMMSDLLDAMAAGGLDGDKVVAYAAFSDLSDASIQAAINEFGGVLFAVDLQQAQQAQTDAGFWDYKRSGVWGGHAILAGKYDKATGRISVVTWQKEVYTTAAFRRYQLTEVWMPVWKSAVDSGKFFANIDAAQFVADYKALTGQDFPVPIVPPPPPPPPPPMPGKGITGTETTVFKDGIVVGKVFVPGAAAPLAVPNVNADTHEIDLSKFGPVRRAILKRKILAQLEDNDHADYAVKGDKIVLTRKVGVDPNKWLDFFQAIMPLIEMLIKLFGGLSEPAPTSTDTGWRFDAATDWVLVC